MKWMKNWQRIEYDQTPIYIRPDGPDWFVPNDAADKALVRLREEGTSSREIEALLNRIDSPAGVNYASRAEHLRLDALKECWIHITNRCNMECRHCLFRSSSRSRDELPVEDCERILWEACDLGCRLFFFTGGEPLFAGAFFQSVKDILRHPDTHVVVLTNLSLLSRTKDQFRFLSRDRLHFQVSVDGLELGHDALRGGGAFRRLSEDLGILRELGFPITLSMTVTRGNVDEMSEIVDFAASRQLSNVHFVWLFRKGHADEALFVDPDRIFPALKAAVGQAEKRGVRIDNVEVLRSQVFSCPGTRYDLSNAGWQSLAVGPDGYVYPTPALVYSGGMRCGHIREGLEKVWKNSAVLQAVRNASVDDSDSWRANPFRYLTGGGDIDHSIIHSGQIAGDDPYAELYTRIAKDLIVREARKYRTGDYPAIRLKMGEKLGDCPAEGGTVFFTHSNCVLSLPGRDIHTQVNRFYAGAAEAVREDILNPVCYEESLIAHIPETMRYRSYGCGSPVLEADIQPGETVVDLGCGTGIECFIAGKLTGPQGRVVGIDMGEAMLAVAEETRRRVAENLSWDNITFKKAFLEDLPLDEGSVDLVISNCVLNLSPDKRRVFQEIFRVLKPEGRLVIADITYDQPIPLEIKYNETLRGECLGGALRYADLFGLLNDIGFSRSRIVAGYPYRTVNGHDFYSITYQAVKPSRGQRPVLYDFPDFDSVMAAVKTEPSCSCFLSPGKQPQESSKEKAHTPHKSGCLVCGAELVYLETNRNISCHYCGRTVAANAHCAGGHFVCDSCHSADAVEIIRQVCLHSRETDAVALMQTIRSHPRFRIHGPEHHALVPAVILAALKNSGNDVAKEQILTAIQRGQTVAGGACAFLGACGAAIGVGIAVSILLSANPYDGRKRQAVQRATLRVLEEISACDAPRCCQRDSWLALQAASGILEETAGMSLTMSRSFVCEQFSKNRECILNRCPLWPREEEKAMEGSSVRTGSISPSRLLPSR